MRCWPKQFLTRFGCFLSLFLMAYSSVGQDKYEGFLRSAKEKEPVEGAVVTFLNESDSSLLDYTISGALGKIEYSNQDSIIFFLRIQTLGFKDTTIHQVHFDQTNGPLAIYLNEETSVLDEVVVSESRFGVEVKGDSVLYDIDLYRTKKDKNLQDLLKKLPGVSVNTDGEIAYNGKRIDGILLEGKDLASNMHQLIGESVEAIDVEGVEVIQNYKAASDKLSNLSTGKVIMNIDLSPASLDKWNAKAKLLAGHRNKGATEISAYKIGDLLSTLNFGRYNSTGQEVINLSDYLSNQTSLSRAFENVDDLNALVPAYFSIRPDLQRNNDAVVNSNFLFTRPKHQIKANVLATRLDRLSQNNFENQYWLDQSIFQGQKRVSETTQMIDLALNYSSKGNEQFVFEFDLPFSMHSFLTSTLQTGVFSENEIETDSKNEGSQGKLSPSVFITHKPFDSFLVSLESNFQLNSTNDKQMIEDIQPLFGTDGLFVSQDLSQNRAEFLVKLKTEYTWKDHTLALAYARRSKKQNIVSESSEDTFVWNNDLTRNEHLAEVTYQYFVPSVAVTLKSKWSSIETKSTTTSSSLVSATEIDLAYKFTNLHSIGIKASLRERPIPLHYLINEVSISAPNEVSLSTIGFDEISLQRTISATYFNFNQKNGLRILGIIDYTDSENSPVAQFNVDNNFARQIWNLSVSENLLRSTNHFNIPLFANSLMFNNQLNFMIGTTLLDENTSIKSETFRSSNQIASNFPGDVDFEVGINYHYRKNDTGSRELEGLSQISYSGALKYTSGNFNSKASLTYFLNQFGAANKSEYLDIGGEVTYDLKDNLSINLEATNVLNLNGTNVVSANFHPTYIGQIEFQRFPGFILMGLTWTL